MATATMRTNSPGQNDVVAIVASSCIEKDSGTFNFLKQQLTPSHTSQLAIVIFDAWRDGWGSDTGRSVSKMESYVRSLGFNASSIKLRMLFDPRCPMFGVRCWM